MLVRPRRSGNGARWTYHRGLFLLRRRPWLRKVWGLEAGCSDVGQSMRRLRAMGGGNQKKVCRRSG